MYIHTLRKNTEAFVVTNKETGLEVNAEKTKYLVMFWDQNAGKNHNIKTGNKIFERVAQCKYLGTILTNQNCIHKEIKSRLGNAGNHLVQNHLSPSQLSKNI